FDAIHADTAAELAMVSSGMTIPFSRANLFGERHLCRTWRFGASLSEPFTVGFLGCVSIEKRAADGSRFRIAGGRLDPLLPGDAVGKVFHRRRRWATPGITVDGSAEHWRSSGSSAVLELADDPLSDIAHRVNGADHL